MPFVSTTGFLNADGSAFEANIKTTVGPSGLKCCFNPQAC